MLIKYQGKDMEVNEVETLTETERWNEYQLTNGKVLSIKTVLISTCEAVDEKTPDGKPLYIVKTHNIVKVK